MIPAVPSMHRIRSTPALFRPLPGGWVVMLGLALCFLGCVIDAPEAPQFETRIYLPLGVRTSTGLDLIDDEGYVEGDSAGAGPLRYVLRGTLPESPVDRLLDLDLPTTWSSFGLSAVDLDSVRPLRAEMLLPSICDQFGPTPHDTLDVLVDRFAIRPEIRALAPPEDVSWVRLQRGRVRLTVRNHLPVPLGGAGGAPVRVRLLDRITGSPLAVGEFAAPIGPGAEGVTETRLDGLEVPSDLDLELSGSSPGSDGRRVDVRATDRVELEAFLSELVADSAEAVVPVQSFTTASSIRVAEDMEISEGLIRYGAVRFTIRNPFPLAGTARATFPAVFRAANGIEPLFVAFDLPAAVGGEPSWGGATLDLGGALFRPREGSGDRLDYELSVQTLPSGSSVRLGTGAAALGTMDPTRIALDSLRGRLDRRRFSIRPTWSHHDPPEGIDSLSFESASLTLEITSTIAFPAEAELFVTGRPVGGGELPSVPLRLSIPAAAGTVPQVTRFTIDESNLQLLGLLRAHPRSLLVHGELLVGSGEEGTIHRTDRVWGAYALSAPLRGRMGRITHRTDPSSFTVDPEDQERIRDHVLGASAHGTVTNHAPAQLEVRLIFAGTEADLALDPGAHPDRVLALDPVAVAPGETDPATGRVVRSRETPLEVKIRSDQTSFFARDRGYSQAVLVVSGEDASRVVEVTAADFVRVAAILDFRVWVR